PRPRLPLAGTPSAARGCNWRPNSSPLEGARPSGGRTFGARAEARALDSEACPLASLEVQCRLIQARVTAEFLGRRLWRSLGFTRLADYAAERLGTGARTLEEDARVAAALEALPAIER